MEVMQRYAAFCGVRVLSWIFLRNRFHLLVEVPPVEGGDISSAEVFRRLGIVRDEMFIEMTKRRFERCQTEEERRAFLGKITRRMGSLVQFMKSLKQRYARWFNGKNKSSGTLWDNRYRSVIVELREAQGKGLGDAACLVAAYIDQIPMRAGLVEEPEDYPWSSYTVALAGDKGARANLVRLWGLSEKASMAAHRALLFGGGEAGVKGSKRGAALVEMLQQSTPVMMRPDVVGSLDFHVRCMRGERKRWGGVHRWMRVPPPPGEAITLHRFRELG
jgi:hypothetical protein